MAAARRVLLGIDIGGTFTDVITSDLDGGALHYAKTPTYGSDLVRSVREAMAAVGVPSSDVGVIRHGTTVVINAILTRTGSRTALVTTAGFRDVLEIGRTNWPEPYNLFFDRLPPLVSRELRVEVDERMAADGTVVRPLDDDDVRAVAARLRDAGVESVAVCFLHSYANGEHERRAGRILSEEMPEAYVSLSHELSRELREYERTSTVVANAYVGRVVDRYIDALGSHLADGGFGGSLYLMESNGGVADASSARRRPVALVESGPAAGVMATAEISKRKGIARAVAFDMGGTTAKACLVEGGEPLFTTEYFVPSYERGFPLRVAALDLLEVGTGGGSIARVDNVGMLTVGPESMGAVPGPACFGEGGTEATVTDANLVLGRLSAERFLEGERRLDVGRAEAALQPLADRLGTDVATAAAGIVRIADVNMAAAIRRISLDRGRDPRDFALFAYGGGGPLHGVGIARELAIPRVVVPVMPGIFSALGMLLADLRQDVTRTFMRDLQSVTAEELRDELDKLGEQAGALESGSDVASRRTVYFADCRYQGQEYTIMVPVADPGDPDLLPALRLAFEHEYQLRYGHAFPELPVELNGLRAVEYVALPKPDLDAVASSLRRGGERHVEERAVHFDGLGYVEATVVDRGALVPGRHYIGPMVVEEYGSTTVTAPGDLLQVDELGQLVIDLDGAPRGAAGTGKEVERP